jgi:hypothetical protein
MRCLFFKLTSNKLGEQVKLIGRFLNHRDVYLDLVFGLVKNDWNIWKIFVNIFFMFAYH